MPECPTCGKQLEPTIRFCPDDGTPVTETAVATVAGTPTGAQRTESKPLDLPLLLGGRYQLVEARGGGGMAKVYRAIDTTLQRDVAVKLINAELRQDPEFDARFQREARIASQLADPHIVVVHDYGFDATHGPYLVMEFLQGLSLREQLQSQGPLPLRAVMQMSAQLLLALIHAHDKGIVHRDIKPDNIFLLNQSGVRLHIRVLDFGIARIYRRDEPSQAETLTRPGAVLGTPRYMSPEQLAGQPVDARSDLYSAALVIYEALTGTLPYVSNKSLVELCPEVPPAFQEVLNDCLQQLPERRPASPLEVYLRIQDPCKASGVLLVPPGALDKLAASRQAEPTVAYQSPAGKRAKWRRRAALAVGLLLLLSLATWAAVALRPLGVLDPHQESILGLHMGSMQDDAVLLYRKGPTYRWSGDPWKRQEGKELLAHVLRPEDLGDAETRAGFEVQTWEDDHFCLILQHDVIRALVVRQPVKCATQRGLSMGATEAHLKQYYPEKPALTTIDVPPGPGKPTPKAKWIEIYRYDELGIGFEIQDGRVVAMTLFPPSRATSRPE